MLGIVKLWITVRVFSLTSACIEHTVQECYCKKTKQKIDDFNFLIKCMCCLKSACPCLLTCTIYARTACHGLHACYETYRKSICDKCCVKQEHIVPSAVDASVADVVEHTVGRALLPRLMGYL